MPNYRRYYVPGGTIFFTVVTHQRRPFLTEPPARQCLRHAIATMRKRRPFEIAAWVLLPDHLHTIWTLPSGDEKYAIRWRRIKEEFTEAWLGGGRKRRAALPIAHGPQRARHLATEILGAYVRG